ncbi:MAG: FAD-dependent oxidoreductase [Betaproteobacteria bacterium]|nr:FAD-dependent oxidoreductase [Betaproteobacteria bacterium]
MTARLPVVEGEWIDRSRGVPFTFDGQRFEGYAGDVPASALWAAGVRVLGRSFKYHRPRGVLSFANHDVNTLMQAGARLNFRADVEGLEPGMALTAVNTAGTAARDGLRILDRLSAFLPVGFYYKAFHRPKGLAPFWENVFRRVTGLGRVDFSTPRLATPKRYDFADVLVVGAGPSGLRAALRAGQAGARVVLVDENARIGGSLGYQRGGERRSRDTLVELEAAIAALPNVSVRPGTLAAGWYADHWVPLVDASRMTKLRAKAVVVAQGVFEQPAVFRNNDIPGVMLASAAQRLMYRYAVKPMHVALVLTANAEGYRAALDLLANGVEVAAVVDLRQRADDEAAEAAVIARGVRVLHGHCVFEAEARADRLVAARVCPLDDSGEPRTSHAIHVACDGILMSVGWAPAAALLYQSGCVMRYDTAVEQFVPAKLAPGVFAAGRVNGVHDLEARLLDGERAGAEAAAWAGFHTDPVPAVPGLTSTPSHPWPIVGHPGGKNFVDFDEDLQVRDFLDAAQEGFDNIELLKRFTTVGMGPSQGKHSNMNAIRILARIRGQSPGEVGTTTARPFFHPVPLSHLAGRGFTARRETPVHERHERLGAAWMQAGIWLRPEYYREADRPKAECVRAEIRAVRSGVGLIDVGTLGKMELHGPDAAAFLERLYTGRFAGLKVGMSRYGLMTDETGVVIDDGVIARLADEHFYFTTTTTGAAAVYCEAQRWNAIWKLRVGLVNVTGAFAAVNLAGPRSRTVLARLGTQDLSRDAFPYLGVRETEVGGIPARVMRVGFVGELGYEIHVPAQYGACLWDRLMEAGREFDIRPFGVEAQRALRLEKGHVIIGQDTDGLTTADEAGLGWAVRMEKPFFVGKRSLEIIRKRGARQTLVGFELDPGSSAVPLECHLVIRDGEIAGRVTSVLESETLGRTVGLVFVRPELAKEGTRLEIRVDGGAIVAATVVRTPFYDPDGARQEPEHE